MFTYTLVLNLKQQVFICFFAYSSKDFQLDASSDTLILEQDDDLKKYRKVIEDYESNDFLIVTFTDKNKILTEAYKVTKSEIISAIQAGFSSPFIRITQCQNALNVFSFVCSSFVKLISRQISLFAGTILIKRTRFRP